MERLRSGCKINIFLYLLNRRPDGYHTLFSLFLPLTQPADEMLVREEGEGCGFIATNLALIPNAIP